MNLLAGKLYDPGTAVNKVTTALLALTALDTTNLRLAFVVPPSGMVWVRMAGTLHGATTFPQIILGVLEGATVRGRVAPMTGGGNLAATTLQRAEGTFLVTGLTPGASLNWDAAYGVETVVAATGLKYGGPNNTTANDNFGGFTFEIWDPCPTYTPTAGTAPTTPISTRIDAIDDFVDTEIATLITNVAAVQADTDNIQTRLPAALVGGRMDSSVGAMAADVLTASALATDAIDEIVDAVWDEVLTGATHNIATSAGRRLRELGTTVIRTGMAQAGAANSITLDASAPSTNEIYDENIITILTGTGAGQTRLITDYNGTSKVAIVSKVWEVNPDATSEFQIQGFAAPLIVDHGIAQGGAATSITLAATASAVDDIYNGNTVYISTSTGSGQTRLITDYNGTTKVATVTPAWVVNPTSASVYKIAPSADVPNIDAIKAKTDSLTFTVAGQLDANIQSINDITITGNGQTGTKFGV